MADICIFAGQGAQVPGMGKDLAQDGEIASLFEKANSVLGFDLAKICFEGPAEELTKSNVCQPAIFVVSYAAYLALQKRRPTAFAAAAGLSLGEWGALCAAGVLDFDATLTVLEARGRFMQEACEAAPSGMIAIVGASAEQLDALCAKTGCTVANINSAAQQVLSGSKEAMPATMAAAVRVILAQFMVSTTGALSRRATWAVEHVPVTSRPSKRPRLPSIRARSAGRRVHTCVNWRSRAVSSWK